MDSHSRVENASVGFASFLLYEFYYDMYRYTPKELYTQ